MRFSRSRVVRIRRHLVWLVVLMDSAIILLMCGFSHGRYCEGRWVRSHAALSLVRRSGENRQEMISLNEDWSSWLMMASMSDLPMREERSFFFIS